MAKIHGAQRLRFTPEDDLTLLRVVVEENPYKDTNRWTIVHENVCKASRKPFTLRAVREHVEHLLQLFMRNDRVNIKKSGTEEEFKLKEKFLREVKDMYKEFKKTKFNHRRKNEDVQKVTRKFPTNTVDGYLRTDELLIPEHLTFDENIDGEEKTIIEIAESDPLSDSLTKTLNSEDSSSCSHQLGPSAENRNTRKIKNQHFYEPDKDELDFKKRKLELEEKSLLLLERNLSLQERKFELEEQKFQFEKKERERRTEIEIKEREAHLKTMERQQEMLQYFFKNSKQIN